MSDVPFRLDIVETGNQWVITCTCPQGKAVSRISAPFTPEVLRGMLFDIEKALIRSYSPLTTRRAAPIEQSVRAFGETLSDAVLAGDVGRLFDRCRHDARERQTSLRVLLDTVGPNVSAIPWEFTVDPDARDDYLALRVPVVRAPHLIGRVPSAPIALPLRILGVSARPVDLPALDAEREREDISKAFWQRLTPGDVHIEWLPEDRWTDLAEAIRSHPWHVLHIMSHGGFDAETCSGYVQLSADDGTARPISAVDLARLISENPSLRLIVLNACESAFPGAEGVFTSTAAKLVREGVPAVVAMQYEITDAAALAFASSFYGQIARGKPVDRAMTRAREAVKMANGSLEWATPVLFLSSEQTQIFEFPAHTAQRQSQHEDTRADPGQDVRPLRPERAPGPERSSPPLLRKLRVLRPAGSCGHMAGGPKGLIAVAGSDGAIRVINVRTGQIVSECTLPQRTRPIQLAWSPFPRHLASLHEDGTIVVWDAETEVPVRIIEIPAKQPELLRVAARRIDSLRAMTYRTEAIAFTSNGKWLVACGDGRVHFFDAKGNHARELRFETDRLTGPWLVPRHGTKSGTSCVIFTPGDLNILVAAADGTVQQIDVQGRILMTLRHPQPVLGMAVTHDMLATGSADGRVRIWSWGGDLIRRVEHGSPVEYLAFSPDGSWLATAAYDGGLSLWSRAEGLAGRTATSGRPVGVRCSEGTVLTANQDGALELWSFDVAAGGAGPS
ncbi:MAG TPA: CHAT domain-containing protein [Streptosporangiaceae bacterium]|nr:CHAT domain-containing protein [Streptosporangiaceae bacterium]